MVLQVKYTLPEITFFVWLILLIQLFILLMYLLILSGAGIVFHSQRCISCIQRTLPSLQADLTPLCCKKPLGDPVWAWSKQILLHSEILELNTTADVEMLYTVFTTLFTSLFSFQFISTCGYTLWNLSDTVAVLINTDCRTSPDQRKNESLNFTWLITPGWCRYSFK